MQGTCAVCKWWDDYSGDDLEGRGVCNRYPPQNDGSPDGYRPWTDATDRCGEHQPRRRRGGRG